MNQCCAKSSVLFFKRFPIKSQTDVDISTFFCRLLGVERLQLADLRRPPGAISDATQARHPIGGHDIRSSVWDFRFLLNTRRNRRGVQLLLQVSTSRQ